MGCLRLSYYERQRALGEKPKSFLKAIGKSGGTPKKDIDYYPFGSVMPGRSFNANLYRYGFQSQEKTDEISGSGNHYTAQYWEYDPRLIRRWNPDPITFPWQSTYSCFNNNPIIYVDPLGLFGTRKEARQYRKENKEQGRIRKHGEGDFSIDNQKAGTSIWNDAEYGISKGALVEADRVPGKVSNLPSDTKVIYDPLSSVERGDINASIPAIILHRTVSSSGKNLYDAWKSSKERVGGTHFLVGEDGTIYQTGNLQKHTDHLLSGQKKQMYSEYFGKILNANTIGIEVIGNYNKDTKIWDPLTPAQVIATAELILELTYRNNLEIHNLLPHEKVQHKTKGEGQTVLDAIIQKVKQDW